MFVVQLCNIIYCWKATHPVSKRYVSRLRKYIGIDKLQNEKRGFTSVSNVIDHTISIRSCLLNIPSNIRCCCQNRRVKPDVVDVDLTSSGTLILLLDNIELFDKILVDDLSGGQEGWSLNGIIDFINGNHFISRIKIEGNWFILDDQYVMHIDEDFSSLSNGNRENSIILTHPHMHLKKYKSAKSTVLIFSKR